MDRKEFLSLLGYGAASLTALGCIGGCSKATDTSATTGPTNIDFTLDLTQTANAALKTAGGYVYANGVIVARTMAGQYIAVQQSCTHESNTLSYQASNTRFYCDRHGAIFSETGAVTGGPAPRALTTYSTSLTGTSLRVYS
jgi:cytochrome b6-f complex iron-sulfur subunit